MRIRTIKPEFWDHPVMSKQSDSTKLLAIGLLNVADDEGYFFAEPRMIRNAIRPLDDDSRITTVSLRELSEIGYISINNHPTHGAIGSIPSFLIHQVINKPKASKIKALFIEGINTVSIPDQYRLEGKGREGNKERKGKDSCQQADVPEIAFIWSNSPSAGKMRSSKKQLAEAWKKLRIKPTIEELKTGLDAWNKCPKWRDGYAEGIHIWLTNEQWENLPEAATNKPNGHHKGIEEIIPLRRL
jgi:hypothetical protein